jgi:hypothetical protein
MRIEWIHHLWATVWGYFWLPCPNCGRMFGGHEVGARMQKDCYSNYGLATCSDPECVRDVEINNARILRAG